MKTLKEIIQEMDTMGLQMGIKSEEASHFGSMVSIMLGVAEDRKIITEKQSFELTKIAAELAHLKELEDE